MTHYDALGVKEGASKDEIKRAFRKRAAECHPDKNPGDPTAEARFKEVNTAYQTLSDDEKRRRYDAELHMSNYGGFGGVDIGPFGMDGDFASRFEEIFGFGRSKPPKPRRRQPVRGGDVVIEVALSLEEVVSGGEKEVTYDCAVSCSGCSGLGSKSGKQAPCAACAGSGQVHESQGYVRFTMTCNACGGSGSSLVDPCAACSGVGRRQARRSIKVSIPPGIDRGDTLRVPSRGHAGASGGPAGDLFVAPDVRPHERFNRRGRELLTTVTVPFPTMALGGTADVTLLDGSTHTLDVAPLTAPGTVVVAKGLGCPSLDTKTKGDLHVRLDVRMPDSLSAAAEEKLRELRGLLV